MLRRFLIFLYFSVNFGSDSTIDSVSTVVPLRETKSQEIENQEEEDQGKQNGIFIT